MIAETLTDNGSRPQAFYESKGKTRRMVILEADSFTKLKAFAKEHGISQGEVLDTLLHLAKPEEIAEHLKATRVAKVDGRVKKGDLARKLKNLSPERLAEIEALLDK